MGKINYKKLVFIPSCVNFSDINLESSQTGANFEDEHFDIGDNNKEVDIIYSKINSDMLLLHILFKLDDRQKTIFLYQILREVGYNLNHENCAQTLSITREHYMVILKKIREKAQKALQESEV